MLVEEQYSDPFTTATINDIMNALIAISGQNIGMTNITDSMKQELISGVDKIMASVCSTAFKFYDENDFEPTSDNIPIFNEIVKSAAESGLF